MALALACKGPASGFEPAEPDDTASDELATLEGTVYRTTDPREDAVGDVFVALFTLDPVWNADDTQVVMQHLIEDVDLSADGSTTSYRLCCIPPRDEPYHLFGFLDDNGTATVEVPEPDGGDLISMVAGGAPDVVLPTTGAFSQDVELNLVMPFR